MAASKPSRPHSIACGYEKMLRAERIAADTRLTRGTRLKARMAADMMRGVIERVPENE